MSKKTDQDSAMMSMGGHLEVLRSMLMRVLAVAGALAVAIFCLKGKVFALLLAPDSNRFITFRLLERAARSAGWDFHFQNYDIKLISTELSSQFMIHISTSLYLGLLLASPYIVFELFRFISPALYEEERRYSVRIAAWIYALFLMGLAMSYFILFPISFQFLATYQVSPGIENTITLESYISTFTTLSFMMGLVFQLPVICYFLAKMGLVSGAILARYRRHAFIVILVIAAIITPPDLFTLVCVSLPMYLLYLVGVKIAGRLNP